MLNTRPEPKATLPSASPPPPKPVSVGLLEPATRISGVSVPRSVLDASLATAFFDIDEPAIVSVGLPGGKTVSLPTRSTFITTEGNGQPNKAIVVDVALLPLSKAVPYRMAVAEAHRLLGVMAIKPDEAMRKQMAAWPDDSNPAKYWAGMWLSDRFGMAVELRSTIDNEWFLVISFNAGADERQALWDPNFKPHKLTPQSTEKPPSPNLFHQ